MAYYLHIITKDQNGDGWHFISPGSSPEGSGEPMVQHNGGLDRHGKTQLRMHQLEIEQAGLTTETTSEQLLPVGAVSVVSVPIEVEIMATANIVQPQQDQQQVGATTEQTPVPSTNGASGGGEKTSEPLKQEVLEIKEFRAGICIKAV